MNLGSLEQALEEIDAAGENPATEVINYFNSLYWKGVWLLAAVSFHMLVVALGILHLFLNGSPLGGTIASLVSVGAIILTAYRFQQALRALKPKVFQLFVVINTLSRARRLTLNETDFIKLIAGHEVTQDGVAIHLAAIGTHRVAADVQCQLISEQQSRNGKRQSSTDPNSD